MRNILDAFGFIQHSPTVLYEDSRAVICMAENPVNRKASRHIDTRKHWIGEAVAAKLIKLDPCSTNKMVTDTLSKNLPDPTFERHRESMFGKNRVISVSMIYVAGG